MQRTPYTLEQAKCICGQMQHFVGNAFDINDATTGSVECIAVSPFDIMNKKKFLLFYLLCDDAVKALNEEYKGLLFDVIVIARCLDNDCDLVQEDISTWLQKNADGNPDFGDCIKVLPNAY